MKSSMLFVLPVVFLVQKVDFTDPKNVLIVQTGFGVVQGLVLLACAFIYLQINKRNDQTNITVPPAASAFGPSGEAQRTTVRDYDIAQLRKFAQQVVIGVCIALFLFVKWNIVPPMAIQCVLNPVNLFGNPLFKLFVLGANQASHPRPFPEENPLGGLLAPQQPAPAAADTVTETANDTKSKKEAKKKD